MNLIFNINVIVTKNCTTFLHVTYYNTIFLCITLKKRKIKMYYKKKN